MAHGNAVRRYFPGMTRECPRCGESMIVTERMCAREFACVALIAAEAFALIVMFS